MRSLEALLTRIVDYAGLFPPAKLDMRPAARNYAAYRAGAHEPMLGRFILPVSRLREFDEAVGGLPGAVPGALPGAVEPAQRDPRAERPHPTDPTEPDDDNEDSSNLWRLSVLTAPPSEPQFELDLQTILAFNDAHDPEAAALSGDEPLFPCLIDTIEVKAPTSADIDAAISELPEGLLAFFEIPIDADPRGLIAALAGEEGVGAKVRTGGVTPDAFPNPDHLARFIHICAAAGVPFKATAGLHHPLRAEYNLTYEPNCPRGVMYGFLNVFLAAAFVYTERMPPEVAAMLLTETSPQAFRFEDGGVRWRASGSSTSAPSGGASATRLSGAATREWGVSADSIARTREQFAISFGSCSFEEPVADLKVLKLL